MTRNSRLSWLAGVSSAAILALGLVGCGDDGDDGNIDGAPVDAVGCEGHECLDPVALLPEGGTLRVEYLHVGNDPMTGDRMEGLSAFLLAFEGQAYYDGEDQKPRPFLGPVVYSSATVQCFDQGAQNLFFNGYNPLIQDLADTRTYYTDVPASLDMTARNSGSVLALNSVTGERDQSNYIQHDQMFLGTGTADELARGDYHDVGALPPGSDFPGLVMESGYDMAANSAPYNNGTGAYLAPDFSMIQPTEDDFYSATGFYFDPTLPLTLEYSMDGNATIPEAAPQPLWFTGFVTLQDYGDGAGTVPTVTHMCLGQAPRSGSHSVEIPKELFADASFAESGAIIAGLITHTAWANNETHRFDIIGMNCDFTGYTTVAPAP